MGKKERKKSIKQNKRRMGNCWEAKEGSDKWDMGDERLWWSELRRSGKNCTEIKEWM